MSYPETRHLFLLVFWGCFSKRFQTLGCLTSPMKLTELYEHVGRKSEVPPYQILQKQLPRFGTHPISSSERWTLVFPPSKTWWNFLQLVGFEQLSWLQMRRHITFYTLQCLKNSWSQKNIIGNQLGWAVSDTMFRDIFAHHISSTSIIRCGHLAPAIAPPSRQSPKMEVWKTMFPFQWCGWFSKFRLFNTFKGG